MDVLNRFLTYIAFDTASCDESETTPSTQKQLALAKVLQKEMEDMGLSEVTLTDKGYVYGKIPAAKGFEHIDPIGFIAHMDTSPECCGAGVSPQIIENYNGEDVPLGESGKVLSSADFSHLPGLKGRTLITAKGNTLLGADNKAGIAEILTLAEKLLQNKIPHGPVSVAFTPDEEIGRGADHFDIPLFGAKYAFTVDGGEEGEIVYENFNACRAVFTVKGKSVHPGSAKNIMVNASLVAMEINSMLPTGEIPAKTEEYEGFYHLCEMEGSVEKATLDYIVRDHSAELFSNRKRLLLHIEKLMKEKYGEEAVTLVITDQYRNMAEKILPCFHLIEKAKLAAEKAGLTPMVIPERGGTDGALLSFKGLPCPNIGTGGYGFHGPFEHITKEGMENAVSMMQNLVALFTE